MKTERLKKIAVTAAPFLALGALAVYLIYHLATLFTSPYKLYLVTKDAVEKKIELNGYVFRDEELIYAPSGAEVTVVAEDGKRVGAGAPLAFVYETDGSRTEIVSEDAGYFYSKTDGLEYAFSGEAARNLSAANFDETVGAEPRLTGEEIGKTATEFRWYFACKTNERADLTRGGRYSAEIEGETVFASLVTLDEGEGFFVAVFEITSIPANLSLDREERATITVADFGVAVPNDAIYSVDGEKCVYMFDGGFARRLAVKQIFSSGNMSIVECDGGIAGQYVIIGKNLYDGKAIH